MKLCFSYKDVSAKILDPYRERVYLDRTTVLRHIVEDLPRKPRMNSTILSGLPGDDNLSVEYASYELLLDKNTLTLNRDENER